MLSSPRVEVFEMLDSGNFTTNGNGHYELALLAVACQAAKDIQLLSRIDEVKAVMTTISYDCCQISKSPIESFRSPVEGYWWRGDSLTLAGRLATFIKVGFRNSWKARLLVSCGKFLCKMGWLETEYTLAVMLTKTKSIQMNNSNLGRILLGEVVDITDESPVLRLAYQYLTDYWEKYNAGGM